MIGHDSQLLTPPPGQLDRFFPPIFARAGDHPEQIHPFKPVDQLATGSLTTQAMAAIRYHHLGDRSAVALGCKDERGNQTNY
jgi:hypothetical protein